MAYLGRVLVRVIGEPELFGVQQPHILDSMRYIDDEKTVRKKSKTLCHLPNLPAQSLPRDLTAILPYVTSQSHPSSLVAGDV